MVTKGPDLNSLIAANRFGLGARGDAPAQVDPVSDLLAEIDAFEPDRLEGDRMLDSAEIITRVFDELWRARQATPDRKRPIRVALRAWASDLYRSEVRARAATALATQTPFMERMVHFWANHFAVSTEKLQVNALAGAFEREAIRPHVRGAFSDMLSAVVRHPAMQFYLDQVRSIGPNSAAGRRGGAAGFNENLGREILELHTLGVNAGYTQADVRSLSLALTGWTIAGAGGRRTSVSDPTRGRFVFNERQHEPGEKSLRGTTYVDDGELQAQRILDDLARDPATGRHIGAKLARHFAGDEPPAEMVDRLALAFTDSDGDLPTVYRALVGSPEAWAPRPLKFKTPWEWVVSSMRALGHEELSDQKFLRWLRLLGQELWQPGSPAGFADVADAWMGSEALFRRIELVSEIVGGAPEDQDPRILAPTLLGDFLTVATAREISRSESMNVGLALLFVSPEFLRR